MDTNIMSGTLNNILEKKLAVYCDNRIALIENLQAIKNIEIKATRVEIIMSVLCLNGHGSIYIDGRQHTMKKNDLLACRPNIILEKSMISADMQFRCICLAPEYVRQLALISNNGWDVIKFLEKNPVIALKPEETNSYCQYYDLIRDKLTGEQRKHQKEIIDSLMQAFLFEFHDVMERFGAFLPSNYSSSERLMKDFMNLLTSLYPKPRMVATYADKLHVTPKYLSAVCKEISGQTASDLINQYVLKDVLYLLKKSEKSIKEIINELDFPNLSFFGKYVKRYTGLSPKQYRKQLAEQETE